MKRFYQRVSVSPGQPAAGFTVMLDARPVRTPARQPLDLPSAALAHAIAAEWDAQDDEIVPAQMPVMQVAATAIDRVLPDIAGYAGRIAVYGETDLVCYRADNPQALVARQWATWQPLVDWAAETLDAPLTVTGGVAPVSQPAASLAALHAAVSAHDPFELAALGLAATASGSLLIALALSHDRLDADAAYAASVVDESWQIEQWGDDDEAAARRRNVRADIDAAARFLALCRQP